MKYSRLAGAVLLIVALAIGIARNMHQRADSTVRVPDQHTFFLADVIQVDIKIYSPPGNNDVVFSRCEEESARCVKIFSKYIDDSELSRINRTAASGHVEISADMREVLNSAFRTHTLTRGAFDITVLPLISAWKDAEKTGVVPSSAELKEIAGRIGMKNIEIDALEGTVRFRDSDIQIDMGGISKGYIVDRLVMILKEAGVERALVNMGGDMRVFGGTEDDMFSIGVQHPRDKDRLIGTIRITEGAVATSGDYERFAVIGGKKYSHIIDPRTGIPVSRSPSVTIIAPDSMTADALATGVSVMGADRGIKMIENIEGVECLIIHLREDIPEFIMSGGMNLEKFF